eukprot:CAMPEP_0172455398 /NCGR_PEP_ID=MMETSP1065-20121228/12048_1 /TAXON_ID=265537 /ORGANISM="Amphiprora paludosa, Strain CCMP125" /LENGTH=214 /DNA_ID=CAMNT_0013207859 /DNA_START=65 /DNA_END=709 /DNA_ORIENTATION=+
MILSNDSTHSTIAIHDAIKKPFYVPSSSASKSNRRRRRGVCFDEDRNEYYTNENRQAQDCHETWYTKEDYLEFRTILRAKIHETINNEQKDLSFQVAIRNMYLLASKVDFILDDASKLLQEENASQLAELYASEEHMDLIGMEYNVVFSIKQDVRKKREEIQDICYDVQGEYDRGLWTLPDMQREMQESCHAVSQSCGLFAQLLAIAQQKSRSD